MSENKARSKNFSSLFQIVLGGLILLWMFSWDDFGKNQSFFDSSPESADREAILRNQKDSQTLFEERVFQGGEAEIIALVNQARKENGLGELVKNEKLSRSAQAKALDMKNKNYFQHVSPEGVQPWFFAEEEKYQYKSFGENLAEGFFSADEVHVAWMNSPGHRENILSVNFSEMGVGLVDFEQNGMKSYLVVQHFGTQLTAQDLIPRTVCQKQSKKDCSDGEKKMEEIKDTIEKQEKIIEKAEEAGATEKDLEEVNDNLEKLKKIKKELKEYLAKCEEFIEGCDQWE